MAAWTAMVVDSGGGNAQDILVNSTSPQGKYLLVHVGKVLLSDLMTIIRSSDTKETLRCSPI